MYCSLPKCGSRLPTARTLSGISFAKLLFWLQYRVMAKGNFRILQSPTKRLIRFQSNSCVEEKRKGGERPGVVPRGSAPGSPWQPAREDHEIYAIARVAPRKISANQHFFQNRRSPFSAPAR